jgi:hypothetical protein
LSYVIFDFLDKRTHTLDKLTNIKKSFFLLKVYMVVNFNAREISRGAHKLARAPILIIIKKIPLHDQTVT